MKEANTSHRIFGLDILRASAIIFVVLMHGLEYLRPQLQQISLGEHTASHYYWLFVLDGVDLFFVLSGFLIGGILLRLINDKEFTRSQLFNFWTRRWFRTLPNYFLILIILLIGYRYAFDVFPGKTPQFFFFTQNFASAHPPFFSESWSLAIEEWFYLLVPLGLFFILLRGKNKGRRILYWIISILVIATVFRVHKVLVHDFTPDYSWDQEIRKQVITRMDSIMYGFLGAWLYHYRPVSWNKRKNLFFIAGLVMLWGSRYLSSINSQYHDYAYISVQALGTLCLLPKLNSIVNGKGIVYKVITFISIISYSMYLLNYTIVLKIIMPRVVRLIGLDYQNNALHGAIGYVLFWGITISLSYVLYRFFEKPMMRKSY